MAETGRSSNKEMGFIVDREMEEIKNKIDNFMKKWNVTVEVKTICEGKSVNGKIVNAKSHLIITS